MAPPAGPCEWCGGPQNWAIIRGDMYVRCIGGCQGLWADQLVIPPHIGESRVEYYEGGALDGTSEMMEGVPPGGDAAGTRLDRPSSSETEPPVGWLSDLWEGAWDG